MESIEEIDQNSFVKLNEREINFLEQKINVLTSEVFILNFIKTEKYSKELKEMKLTQSRMQKEYDEIISQISEFKKNWSEIKLLAEDKTEKLFRKKSKSEAHLVKIHQQQQKVSRMVNVETETERLISLQTNKLNGHALIETEDTEEKIQLEINQLEKAAKIKEFDGLQLAKLKENYDRFSIAYNSQIDGIQNLCILNEKLKNMLDIRLKNYTNLLNFVVERTEKAFQELLEHRGYKGFTEFDHNSQKLTIHVNSLGDDSECKDTKGLSGGERSFSTLSFIISLWQSIDAPFRCLDEFDVFMDLINRRTSLKLLRDFAASHPNEQVILITPQDVRYINLLLTPVNSIPQTML
ncbi:hypothetical protein MXB_149, partial [Myxobolus squamalis]